MLQHSHRELQQHSKQIKCYRHIS